MGGPVILSGCSGFIGTPLTQRLLAAGKTVVFLTRRAENAPAEPGLKVEVWDGRSLGPWSRHVDGADALINLAGESVAARRWSPAQKARIIASRLDATRALVAVVKAAARPPATFINASATGFYGHVPAGDVDENTPSGQGFLAQTCRLWEAEAGRAGEAERPGQTPPRVVMLRTGVVLDRDGGALAKMLPVFSLGLGGLLGDGRQWFPWIHRDDAVGAILFLLAHPEVNGPVNLTAPHPVTNAAFTRELATALGRPAFLRVPGLALKLVLGEMAQMLLTGQRVIPKKLLNAGYPFRFAHLPAALTGILSSA